MLKQLVYSKNIEDVSISVEIETDIESYLFGTYYITCQTGNTEITELTDDKDIKNICNEILKTETINDAVSINNQTVRELIVKTINLNNWKSVASDVAYILNFILSTDEISLYGDHKMTEKNVCNHLEYRVKDCASSIIKYANKNDLIRFVCQIFVTEWLQSANGIRRCLGRQVSVSRIEQTFDSIQNTDVKHTLKYGEDIIKASNGDFSDKKD